VQSNLTLLNYNTRGVDGIFGRGSRGAITNWQQSNGFPQTSYLTQDQVSLLDAQAARRKAEIEADEARELAQREALDRSYWAETGSVGDEPGTVGAYQEYLAAYPDGVFANAARDIIENLTEPRLTNDQVDRARAEESRLRLSGVRAQLLELRLRDLGYNPGRLDGVIDGPTRGAIQDYQTDNGLLATGYVDQATALGLMSGSLTITVPGR